MVLPRYLRGSPSPRCRPEPQQSQSFLVGIALAQVGVARRHKTLSISARRRTWQCFPTRT